MNVLDLDNNYKIFFVLFLGVVWCMGKDSYVLLN